VINNDLQRELEIAEGRVERLKRALAAAPCSEVGHRWEFRGGCNVGCEEMDKDCSCSVSVHECSVCGDCDYGQNPEREEVLKRCAETGCGN
jgi:hypothetical protein